MDVCNNKQLYIEKEPSFNKSDNVCPNCHAYNVCNYFKVLSCFFLC